jgi:hypothetical protein
LFRSWGGSGCISVLSDATDLLSGTLLSASKESVALKKIVAWF